MTEAQINLLRALMKADRQYWHDRVAGEVCHQDDRGVEVSPINGVDRRTAQALVERDLIETLDMGGGRTYAFLGSYDPFGDIK